MTIPRVAIVRYEEPLESVRKAVELSDGLAHLPAGAKVFIKPNIVFWTRAAAFPKWGVITTSRVVQDMVTVLKDRGIDDITIGEGTVLYDPKDRETPQHAFETLGYRTLAKRYGVKVINTFERPFEKVDLGDGVRLNFSADALASDFVVNIPVLKTHAQTVVSLGIKNIKGLIDIVSRKKCHSADPEKDLHFMVSRLADRIPPSFTILDGIFTNERGPSFDGRMRRSNILVASSDVLAADMVGAKILGYEPSQVPHLVHAARNRARSLDLSSIEIRGEKPEDLALDLQYTFAYNEDGTLPKPMEKMGIAGLSYPKYDLSLCTYCSILTGVVLTAIAFAWKGQPWDDVEVLTGKTMQASPGRKKTILLGKCMYEAHKDHPNKENLVAIKTCPPSTEAVAQALIDAGIPVDPQLIRHPEMAPAFLMPRYAGKPEFDESLFVVE
jgi:uncharacterized protein (DUF362 family)